jgi:beta-galactosidase
MPPYLQQSKGDQEPSPRLASVSKRGPKLSLGRTGALWIWQKALLVVLFLAASGFGFALPLPAADEPAATATRSESSFDFGWRFNLGDAAGAEAVAYDDGGWRGLDLPHDWSIEGSYDENAATGGPGGYLPTGIGWYRKHFTVPESDRGRSVHVRFDGVYERSTVWVNGHPVGSRPYGYSSFAYEIARYLNFGGAPNVIAVRVDNSQQPNSRWYSGSGIYRHTWLVEADPTHVIPSGIQVTTPTVTPERATVRARVSIYNADPKNPDLQVSVSVISPAAGDGAHFAPTVTNTLSANPGTLGVADLQLDLDRPLLWSVDTPNVYRMVVKVSRAGVVVDQSETTFGIRTVVFDVDRGVLLNGSSVKLRGFCIHHDAGAVGAAVPDAVLERRLRLLREMGCNAVRCSHYPMAPEFYDICDRIGLLVVDEAFDEWTFRKPQLKFGYSDIFNEWYERDVTDLVRRDRNHPCVILWNAGNEVGEQWSPTGPDVLAKILAVFQREDPTRLVTVAMDNVFNQNGPAPEAFTRQLGVVGYNYVDRWGTRRETQYADDRAAFPTRRFLGTEETGVASTRGVYEFGSLFGDNDSDDHLVLGDGPAGALYVAATQRASSLWKFVALHDYVAGQFVWTGFDYLGESRWPLKLTSFGALDTCGFKKDSYYFFQSLWTDAPMVHLLPHWNWPGKEGTVIPVVAYSNAAAVELYLNGKSFGVKAREFPSEGVTGAWNNYLLPKVEVTTGDLQLTWDVPYAPGVLKAVAYDRLGHPVAETTVRTAGPATRLELTTDSTRLAAGRRDVASVAVRALDAEGNFVPLADNVVRFSVSGPATMIGVDNGDPASHESYKADHRVLFNGLAAALIQSTADTGRIHVSASADGLAGAGLDLDSAPAK